MPTIMQTLRAVQTATLQARAATGMPGIGTRVSSGRFQVINTSAGKRGAVVIDELSDWLSSDSAVELLNDIAADKACRT